MPNYIHSFELFEWVCHWKSVLKIFNSHNIICINFLNEFLVLDQSDERTEKAYCTAAELTLFYVCCCSLSYFFKEQSLAINNAKHNGMIFFQLCIIPQHLLDVSWPGLSNRIQPMYYLGNHGVSSEYICFFLGPVQQLFHALNFHIGSFHQKFG